MTENQNTEWKESWRDVCLKWICEFANAEGGVLIRRALTMVPNIEFYRYQISFKLVKA